ncbi:MAG: hypothetical protein EU529_16395 [Promethearchaeota archaeon]|nr:MAG: hypothetical protein EU529_16395 [Candidatus Lokiarchaeota archaeon]
MGSVSFFALVFGIASDLLGEEVALALSIVLTIFAIIAALGGVAVIIGVILVTRDKIGLGKFIIGLGAGMGLIGLIIFIISSFMAGVLAIIYALINGGYGLLGVILTILARRTFKKD